MSLKNAQTIVRDAETKEGLIKTLGIRFTRFDPDHVVATMPVTPLVHQLRGLLHGGASVALAETVASVGGRLSCTDSQVVFGMEINANHLKSITTGMVTATGIPLHRGRKTHVWEIKIRDEKDRLICVSRCTLAIVEKS